MYTAPSHSGGSSRSAFASGFTILTASGVSWSTGGSPVSNSQSTTPKAKVSVFSETRPSMIYSGGMYGLVPITIFVEWCVLSSSSAGA